jgi:hypothetical protein
MRTLIQRKRRNGVAMFKVGDRVRVTEKMSSLHGQVGTIDYIGDVTTNGERAVRIKIDKDLLWFVADDLELVSSAYATQPAGVYKFRVNTVDEIDLERVCREAEAGTDAILVSAGRACVWGLARRYLSDKIPGKPFDTIWAGTWCKYKLSADDSTTWVNYVQKARAAMVKPAAKIAVTVTRV